MGINRQWYCARQSATPTPTPIVVPRNPITIPFAMNIRMMALDDAPMLMRMPISRRFSRIIMISEEIMLNAATIIIKEIITKIKTKL